MSSSLNELSSLRRDIEAMGSLPLLPPDDFVEYSGLCQRVLAIAGECATYPAAIDDAEPVAKVLYDIGLVLRRAGDGLASAEVLDCAGRFAEAHGDRRRASSCYNSAGITLYQLGVYDRAYEMLDRALAVLPDDEFGRVRTVGILLNRANVLHYERRFEEAEHAYLALIARIEQVPAEHFASHSTFGREEVRGFLGVNVAGNRCLWAQRDAEQGLPIGAHTAIARAHLEEALTRPVKMAARMTGHCLRAHLHILEGRPDLAEPLLEQLAGQCAGDRELLWLLPQIYRYAAEASVALGDGDRALMDCHRALESSLAVANDLEERTVVDTFVEMLGLSSRCLFDPSDPAAQRASRFVTRAGGLVGSLVDFLERKDWYTGHNHSRAVATLSTRIGKVLVAAEGAEGARARAEIEENTLHLAATLHDVGKLSLPWSLLNKIVPLSEWERAMLRAHPALGEDILRRVGLPEIGALTAEHHETPDGTGYPRGVKNISLMGSILGIADAFEAMTSASRAYRTPKSLDEAVREIRDGSGTQFDPTVAAATISLFSHKV